MWADSKLLSFKSPPEHVDPPDVYKGRWLFENSWHLFCVLVYVMAVTYLFLLKGCLCCRKLCSSSKGKYLLPQYWELSCWFLCMHWNVFLSLQQAVIKFFYLKQIGAPTVYKVNLRAVVLNFITHLCSIAPSLLSTDNVFSRRRPEVEVYSHLWLLRKIWSVCHHSPSQGIKWNL